MGQDSRGNDICSPFVDRSRRINQDNLAAFTNERALALLQESIQSSAARRFDGRILAGHLVNVNFCTGVCELKLLRVLQRDRGGRGDRQMCKSASGKKGLISSTYYIKLK